VAKRVLAAGVAHPTYASYTDDSMLESFASARETKQAAFSEDDAKINLSPNRATLNRGYLYVGTIQGLVRVDKIV